MLTREEHLKEIQEVRQSAFRDRVNDLEALKNAFGAQVPEIVAVERAKKVKAFWQSVAEQQGRNDIEGLKQTLWAWVAEAGFEFTSSETTEGTQFIVTRCPLAEMARAIDAAEWGYLCYCADDPHIVAGFNPQIEFRRTRTLMAGDDCCDHFYCMKAK